MRTENSNSQSEGASAARALANFLGGIFAIFFFAVSCTKAVSASPVDAASDNIENPHLYQVQKGPNVSWIFGTIHRGVAFADVAKSIEPKLKSSRVMFLEIADPGYMSLSLNNPIEAILRSDLDLDDGEELSPEIRNRLVKEYGIPAKIAGQMHSESCTTFVTSLRLKEPDLDAQIFAVGAKAKKEMRPLDSNALRFEADEKSGERRRTEPSVSNKASNGCDLVDLFMSVPVDYHLAALRKQIDRYRSGGEISSKLKSSFIRNDAWMKKLGPELERGGVFAAFGAGHLYGPKGLIRALRSQGYEVSRVR